MSSEPQAATPTQSPAPTPTPNLSIRTKPPSPKRLSRNVLLAGALAAAAIAIYAMMAGLSDQRHHVDPREAETAAATATPPQTIARASSDYDPATLEAPHDMLWADHPPPNAQGAMLQPPTDPNLANAPPNAAASGPAGAAQSRAPDPQQVAYAAPLLYSQQARMRSQTADAHPVSGETAGDRNGFLASQRDGGEGALSSPLQPPHARYQVQAGAVIPAALLTELNSDLPGRVIAQVTAPVYDSVTGSEILIPQGARLIGAYDNATAHGDERILLAWNRIVFPNGWSLSLEGMEATDPSGAAGLRDRTDNHLGALSAAVGLATIFSVLANNSENDHEKGGLGQTVADAAAQQAAQSGSHVVDRDLQVHPTLRVRVGAPVRVLVTRDIALRPYVGSR